MTVPPGFALGSAQVIHVSIADGTMGVLSRVSLGGRTEAEACSAYSGKAVPFWFDVSSGDEPPGVFVIGLCPCICADVGDDPVLVRFGCSSPYLSEG